MIRTLDADANEWLKLKEMYGWSFETAEEARVVIEGNRRREAPCCHCGNMAPLCCGEVEAGHWYCSLECASPYK